MGNLGMDVINVSVIDQTPPDADAGDDITIDGNGTINFNGTGSTDNVRIISWIWKFNYNGKNITLNGSNPLFFFNISGKYIVYLYVTDGFGNEDMDWMSVTVNEIEVEPKEDDDNGDIRPSEEEKKDESSSLLYILLAVLIVAFVLISIAMLVLKKIRRDKKDQIELDEEVRVETTIRPLGEVTLNERRGKKEDEKMASSDKTDDE